MHESASARALKGHLQALSEESRRKAERDKLEAAERDQLVERVSRNTEGQLVQASQHLCRNSVSSSIAAKASASNKGADLVATDASVSNDSFLYSPGSHNSPALMKFFVPADVAARVAWFLLLAGPGH